MIKCELKHGDGARRSRAVVTFDPEKHSFSMDFTGPGPRPHKQLIRFNSIGATNPLEFLHSISFDYFAQVQLGLATRVPDFKASCRNVLQTLRDNGEFNTDWGRDIRKTVERARSAWCGNDEDCCRGLVAALHAAGLDDAQGLMRSKASDAKRDLERRIWKPLQALVSDQLTRGCDQLFAQAEAPPGTAAQCPDGEPEAEKDGPSPAL